MRRRRWLGGGFTEQDVQLGDVLISDQVVDYEQQSTPLDPPKGTLSKTTPKGPEFRYSVHRADPRLLGAAQGYRQDEWLGRISVDCPAQGRPRRVIGPIATGDKVIAYREMAQRLLEEWPKLIGVEMEAGGAASAYFQAAQPPGFFMVRAVSDMADEKKSSRRGKRWRRYACEVAAAYAIALVTVGAGAVGRPEVGWQGPSESRWSLHLFYARQSEVQIAA